MEEQYYLKLRGKVTGPFSFERIKQLYDRGQLTPYHQVSADRRAWSPLESLEGIVPEVAEQPQQSVAEAVLPVEEVPTSVEQGPPVGYTPPQPYQPVISQVSPAALAEIAEQKATRMALTAVGLSVGAVFVSPAAVPALVFAGLAATQLRDRALASVTLVLSILLSIAGGFVSWTVLTWLI